MMRCRRNQLWVGGKVFSPSTFSEPLNEVYVSQYVAKRPRDDRLARRLGARGLARRGSHVGYYGICIINNLNPVHSFKNQKLRCGTSRLRAQAKLCELCHVRR